MAYTDLTTAANIQAFYPGVVFTTSTRPTLASVNSWIVEATAYIYNAISIMYEVPITNASDLAILRGICEIYVRNYIDFTLGHNSYLILSNGTQIPRTLNQKEFFESLNKVVEGHIPLVSSIRTSYVSCSSYNAVNGITFESSKSETLW